MLPIHPSIPLHKRNRDEAFPSEVSKQPKYRLFLGQEKIHSDMASWIFDYLPFRDVLKFRQVSQDNRSYADSFISEKVARNFFGVLSSLHGTTDAYRMSGDIGSKIWELCKTDPSKLEKNLPFFRYWLEKQKILVMLTQKDKNDIRNFLHCQTSPRLSDALLRFIVSHLFPELTLRICEMVPLFISKTHSIYSVPHVNEDHDIATLRQMINAGIDLEGKDYKKALEKGYPLEDDLGDTTLHSAAESYSKEVKYLVYSVIQKQGRWKKLINQPNTLRSEKYGWTPVMHAMAEGCFEEVVDLIKADANPHHSGPNGETLWDLQDLVISGVRLEENWKKEIELQIKKYDDRHRFTQKTISNFFSEKKKT